MKNSLSLSLSALLLLSVSAARAATPPAVSASPAGTPSPVENRRYGFADKALDALALKITEVKKCVVYWESLKTELSAKKQDVASENNGSVPGAYDELFAIKNARISKVYTTCADLNKELDSQFEQARLQIHAIEPSSSAGIPARRERLGSLRTLSNSIVKRLH